MVIINEQLFGVCLVFALCLPSRFAAAALSCLILVSALTCMGRGGFFLCSFFFLGLPCWLDTSIVSSSGSVCCTLSVGFDRRRRLRRMWSLCLVPTGSGCYRIQRETAFSATDYCAYEISDYSHKWPRIIQHWVRMTWYKIHYEYSDTTSPLVSDHAYTTSKSKTYNTFTLGTVRVKSSSSDPVYWEDVSPCCCDVAIVLGHWPLPCLFRSLWYQVSHSNQSNQLYRY